MAQKKIGTKHVCGGCSSKFYDLGRDSIECPKCGWMPGDASQVTVADVVAHDEIDDGVLKLRIMFEDGSVDSDGKESDDLDGDEDNE